MKRVLFDSLERRNLRGLHSSDPMIALQAQSNLQTLPVYVDRIFPNWLNDVVANDAGVQRPEVKVIRAYRRGLVRTHRSFAKYPPDWAVISLSLKHDEELTCAVCRREFGPNQLHAHHIVFRSRSGTNSVKNLVILCRDCHQDQHDHPIGESGGEEEGEVEYLGLELAPDHPAESAVNPTIAPRPPAVAVRPDADSRGAYVERPSPQSPVLQPLSARPSPPSVPSSPVSSTHVPTPPVPIASIEHTPSRSRRFLLAGIGVVAVLVFLGNMEKARQSTPPPDRAIVPILQQEQQASTAEIGNGMASRPLQTQLPASAKAAEQATWEATISRWQQQHADFLSDPVRRRAMAVAFDAIEAESGGTLEHADLIQAAYKRAALATGWLTVRPSTSDGKPRSEPGPVAVEKCVYNAVMTDDDLRACGITPPASR